jgi:opacity protein-like surface antigen
MNFKKAIAVTASICIWEIGAASTELHAADMLRGSFYEPGEPQAVNWSGSYVGGHVGHIESKTTFDNSVGDLVANILRYSMLEAEAGVSNWTTIGSRDVRGSNWGVFAGYNTQWDNAVVLGVEANYNRASLKFAGSGGLSRIVTLSDNFQYAVTVAGQSTLEIRDYGTVRARAGYIWENIMPYATLGVALGRANTSAAAVVGYPQPVYSGTATPPPPTPPAFVASETSGRSNQFIYGFSAGLGVDVMLLPNFFLRGEYEYIKFTNVDATLNNIRAGAALKF